MRAALEQFWYGLSLREQRLLLVAGGLLSVTMFYWGIMHPLLHQREEAQRRLDHARTQWRAVVEALQQLPASANASQVGQDPVRWLQNTARGVGLRASVTAQTDGSLKVVLSGDGTALAGWLKRVQKAGFGLWSLSLRQKQGDLQGEVVLTWR